MIAHFSLFELTADFQEGGPTTHFLVEHVDETGQPTPVVRTLLIKDGVHIVYSQKIGFLGMQPHMNYRGRFGRKTEFMDFSDMWTAEAQMTDAEARAFFYSFIDIERGDTVHGENRIDGTGWCDYRGKRAA